MQIEREREVATCCRSLHRRGTSLPAREELRGGVGGFGEAAAEVLLLGCSGGEGGDGAAPRGEAEVAAACTGEARGGGGFGRRRLGRRWRRLGLGTGSARGGEYL